MYTWWEEYCSRDRHRRLAIIVGRRDNEVVAILPAYVRRMSAFGLGLCEFAFLGTEYETTDYLQVIERADELTHLPAMLEVVIQHESGLDILVLENILAAHPLLASLEATAAEAGFSCEWEPHRICPYVEIRGDWDSYLAVLSSKLRKNLRRATRQLLDAGAEFSFVQDRSQVAAAIADLFALHEQRFVSKKTVTGFRADLRAPFHTRVSELFLDLDILRLFCVKVEKRTIASLYCFEHEGVLFYFQGGVDPSWEKLSVGTVLVGHAIKYAFERRLHLFDFMRGGEEYKFRWTDTIREIVVARIGISWRGRTALTLRRHGIRAKRLAKHVIRPEPTAVANASGASA